MSELRPGLSQGKTRAAFALSSALVRELLGAGPHPGLPGQASAQNKTLPVEINPSNSVLQIRESRLPSRLRALLGAEHRFPESPSQ